MIEFRVTAYENESSDFWNGWKKGDRLAKVAEFSVLAATPAEALEEAWHIGNKQPVSWPLYWPRDHRSMSMGDVVVLDHEAAYAVARFGWEEVTLSAEDVDG